jgi:anti-anti-sigma factor
VSQTRVRPADQDFQCEVRSSGRAATWIRAGGVLDLSAAPRFERALQDALSSALLVIVDLRELTFMDIAGLNPIVEADARARRSDRRLVFVRPVGPDVSTTPGHARDAAEAYHSNEAAARSASDGVGAAQRLPRPARLFGLLGEAPNKQERLNRGTGQSARPRAADQSHSEPGRPPRAPARSVLQLLHRRTGRWGSQAHSRTPNRVIGRRAARIP